MSLRKGVAFLLCVAVVAGLMMMVLSLRLTGEGQVISDPVAQRPPGNRPEVPSPPVAQSSLTKENEKKGAHPSPLFLGDECPETLNEGVLSDEGCLEALERHFLNSPAYEIWYVGMVPKDASFTYREMFASYEQDRKRVIEALSRPECRLLEGPIRPDLQATCSFDALSRFTFLAETCLAVEGTGSHLKTESPYMNMLAGLEEFREVEPAHLPRGRGHDRSKWYHVWHNEFREGVLKNAWLFSKDYCPLSDLRERGLGEEFASLLGANLPDLQIERLSKIVIRLGEERLLVHPDFSMGKETGSAVEFRASWRELFPWLSLLFGVHHWAVHPPRSEAVARAAKGIVELRRAGYEADVEDLVERLCIEERQWYDWGDEDCAMGIQKAEDLLDPTDMESLRALDEIEDAALKLGVYQRFYKCLHQIRFARCGAYCFSVGKTLSR